MSSYVLYTKFLCVAFGRDPFVLLTCGQNKKKTDGIKMGFLHFFFDFLFFFLFGSLVRVSLFVVCENIETRGGLQQRWFLLFLNIIASHQSLM